MTEALLHGRGALLGAALLFTNEYNVLDGGNNLEPYIALVTSLRAAAAPIDGVGVQAHMTPATNDGPTVYARLDRLAVLGLPIWVTELDITASSEATRAAELEEFLRAAFSHPKVDGIILWGFWAGCHWRGPEAALWDADWRLNAAGERWLRLTQQEWSTTVTTVVPGDGAVEFRGFHGEYVAEVEWGDGTQRRVPFLLPKGSGEATVRLAISDRPDDGGSGLLVR